MNHNAYVTEKELSSQETLILRQLGNTELLSRFGKLVQTERKITHLVLECIAEIDIRKLYLERAYPSLYEFLVQGHGYSPSSAVRRIESARLLQEIPEIAQKIESGALNLSQISMVSQSIRQVQKSEDRKVETPKKLDILSKIEYSTQYQTEQIISQEFDLPIIREEKEKVHRDESVTLTLTFSKEEMKILENAADLISHSVPEKKWSHVMIYLAQNEISRRSPIKRAAKEKKATPGQKSPDISAPNSEQPNLKSNTLPKTSPASATARKAIRLNIKKAVFEQNRCCQFQDPITKKICGSTRFLQIDHIQPIWAGGTNDLANLRVLCAQHNQFKYQKESSIKSQRLNPPPLRR